MLLTIGVFLFNLMCATLIPCDIKYESPEILSTPRSFVERANNMEKSKIEPIVTTLNGKVQGHLLTSTNGKTFFAFEGIPYGETTGGANRWKPPIPKRPWKGIRKATAPGPECLQVSLQRLLRVHGSEKCLSINIYTPNLPKLENPGSGYPVIVFIHGGSFLFGSGAEYQPSYLLNEEVILVTFNYRLGVLGFLSTGDLNISGNYGLKIHFYNTDMRLFYGVLSRNILKDQALALKYVHDNIRFFGGNPNNVTLLGNSAGGVSVHLHMISNKTREYFSTAFSSSGTAFQHWGVITHERMNHFANKLAERFGCRNRNSWKLVECLRRIDANFLVAAQMSLFDWFPIPPVMFAPVVEPNHPDAFLTISPENAYRLNAVANKPYIFGVTKDEGRLMLMIMLIFGRSIPLRLIWNQIAPYCLEYKHLVSNSEEITKKISDFYWKGKSPLLLNHEDFVDMFTDRFLSTGIVNGVQHHASSGAPTYFYYFSFSEGNHNQANAIGYKSSEWGAGHAEDILYILNDSSLKDGHKHSDPDAELSSIMIKFLVNFASTGKPTLKTKNGEVLEFWDPVHSVNELRCLQLDKQIEMIPYPEYDTKRINFWNSLNLSDSRLLSPLYFNKSRKV